MLSRNAPSVASTGPIAIASIYSMVILPYDGMPHGLFVEVRLTGDNDPDFPRVTLVGAHPEIR